MQLFCQPLQLHPNFSIILHMLQYPFHISDYYLLFLLRLDGYDKIRFGVNTEKNMQFISYLYGKTKLSSSELVLLNLARYYYLFTHIYLYMYAVIKIFAVVHGVAFTLLRLCFQYHTLRFHKTH